MSGNTRWSAQARELFRSARGGLLSSHSGKFPGFPYGSAVPHATDQQGRPVILISELAEHTHNVKADSRVSFLVSDSGPDLQAGSRATMLGHARALAADRGVQERYFRFFPEQAQYLELGGFHFWVIEPLQVRLIQGFGSLHWITATGYLAQVGELPMIEASILKHMNGDHRDAVVAYCQHSRGEQPRDAEMIAIDCDGFDVRSDGQLLRFKFEQAVTTGIAARAALTALARSSRR